MEQIIENISDWCNQNSGFVSVLIFITTLIIGWVSGFFRFLRKRPKLIINTIEGPTFCSTISLNKTYQGLPVHKTAFVLYLEVTNKGNANTTIGKIKLGYYHDDDTPLWRSKRNWIHETILKSEITTKFRNSKLIKGFPFLKQKNYLFTNETDTFLEVGKIINGIVYFEELETFGNWNPRLNKDKTTTNIKIKIQDAFGRNHSKCFDLKIIEPEKALEMAPYFGQTYNEYFVENEETPKNE